MRPASRAASFFLLAAVVIAALAIPAASNAQAGANSADLAAAKVALSKYSDPIAAVRDGYLSTLACIDFPKGATDGPVVYPPGAMGIHFINMANVGPKLDPAKPQVLIYEQVGNKLKLTAAEWFMPVQLAGGVAPAVFGQTLNGPMDGHEPIMPASLKHYDLHVWFWKNNPKGMFTSTNSAVKCAPGGTYTVAVTDHQHH